MKGMISHPGNPKFPIDIPAVAEAAAKHHVALEINNSSFLSSRIGRGNHRFSVGGFILRREYRLMKTGNNQIQRGQHWSGTVNFTLGIFRL
jgi:hypothetical protein